MPDCAEPEPGAPAEKDVAESEQDRMSSYGNLIRADDKKTLRKQKSAGNFDIRRWR